MKESNLYPTPVGLFNKKKILKLSLYLTPQVKTRESIGLTLSTTSPIKQQKKSLKRLIKDIESIYPSHLEVIEKVKKIKSLSNPLPFSPEIPPVTLPYGKKSITLQKKIQIRQDFVEYLLPEEPYNMEKFLKRIKETERVIRQENEFIKKVRKFKPKIQLQHGNKRVNTPELSRTARRRSRNKTPIHLNRTGIMMRSHEV